MPDWVKPWLCISALLLGILLSVRPIFLLLETAITDGIAPGAATLIAAAVGFTAVAWQTGRGFRNLARSQDNQARLDREAREHQADIARRARAADRTEEQRTLAAALSGELSAAYTRLSTGLPIMKFQQAFWNNFGNDIPSEPIDTNKMMPVFEPQIFLANIPRLGLLGPSIASDLVEIYQLLVWKREMPLATKLNGKMISALFDAQVGVIDTWLLDQFHVQKRLMSLFGSQEDPGPLLFERQKRTTA